jgi:hypothetical protein
MFLTREKVIEIISEAIFGKSILNVTYQHMGDQDVVTRKMAPFDIGTTNQRTIESNKNQLYSFCYDHKDKDSGVENPMVHPINIEHIISIEKTGETFDENELADTHMANSGYDYRKCLFAVMPDRNWFN